MLIYIRGAGDIASGITIRLRRSGFRVVMTDVARPTAIRRTVSFSGAIISGSQRVEDVTARLAHTPEEALGIARGGDIAVMVDENCAHLAAIRPDAVVDAILAKRNLGTTLDMAPAVIGVGPGFTAGLDCHAVVETMRGHTLGRVYYTGSALPNTAVPGLIGGYAGERVLRALSLIHILGLRNVDAILRLHYGDAYGLRFPPVSGHGTCVAISLPAVRKEEEEC